MSNKNSDYLKVALAQIAPVWLNKKASIQKVKEHIEEAADNNADLVIFGEAILPGYPFWIELTNGAKFESKVQKEFHSHYLQQAVRIEEGDLDSLCEVCKKRKIATIVGTIELAANRGNHSVYCTLVYIDKAGEIKTIHRKLMPTYEERLSWSPGDGHGLRVHKLGAFSVGALNCWENWMPLVRSALYGMGEDLHVAIWPGGMHNTPLITPFIAKESRSYSISVCGILKKEHITSDIPNYELILENCGDFLGNGGTCIADPTGKWLIEPIKEKEGIFYADLDFELVRQERQNFDPVGHYSRPDVTQLHINRERQSTIKIKE